MNGIKTKSNSEMKHILIKLVTLEWKETCSCGSEINFDNIDIISQASDKYGVWYRCCNCGSTHLERWNKK